ncbi:Crp/Fnr family transcriptional regulator [Flagellimonas sp. 2504JD4-2]
MASLFERTLQQLGHFPNPQLQHIIEAASLREIPKNEILLKPGDICESFQFIEKGALYQYLLDEDNQEHILDLHCTGDWALNVQSFTQRKPSESFLTVYSDSVIYELNIHKVHELIEKYPSMMQLGKILGADAFRIGFLDKKMSPKEKYELLVQQKPQLIQAFPLFMIASFLKISPETLSRIRGQIS